MCINEKQVCDQTAGSRWLGYAADERFVLSHYPSSKSGSGGCATPEKVYTRWHLAQYILPGRLAVEKVKCGSPWLFIKTSSLILV